MGTSFSIWGIIFLWQALWVLWQFMPSQRNSEGVIKASYFYPAMTLFQGGWTISFSYEIMWLSLVFMYAILATLVAASMSLQTYKKTIKGYLLWQGPFSIQTGWIMAAAAVNTNVLPVFYGASVPVKLAVSSVSLVVLAATALSFGKLSRRLCDSLGDYVGPRWCVCRIASTVAAYFGGIHNETNQWRPIRHPCGISLGRCGHTFEICLRALQATP